MTLNKMKLNKVLLRVVFNYKAAVGNILWAVCTNVGPGSTSFRSS